MLSRILAGWLVAGVGLAAGVLLVLAMPAQAAFTALAVSLVEIVAAVVFLVLRAEIAAGAWRILCLVVGVPGIVIGAVSLGMAGAQWPTGWSYEREIVRRIGPISFLDMLSHHIAELGVLAVALGIILLALGYWLFPPYSSHRRRLH